ncbi:RimJ/RimL family protein N-acetyltransferase [Allocatelliglobosispora scoriae]|uniref:RimJ/RimL family protein N-acetyltransferase n=1 Tax=Allocatelliglobosispora scoriae TaxID=643052 RepID=A0A841C1Y4_9ACTN|nr:GNAT family protein [Allocatelliglobosispora scoriae]MBB5873329.1 RimJ/RimL family protein N-acetyltransferase [Allocatelliglobosispora scoriae]
MPFPVTIDGGSIVLRELQDEDLPALTRLYTDPELTQFMGFDQLTAEAVPGALHAHLVAARREPRTQYTLAITVDSSPDLVGVVRLLVEEYGRNAMLGGLIVIPESAGVGRGVEASRLLMAYGFGPLGLHRIWGGRRTDYLRMHDRMTRLGLHQEGFMRELFHTHGVWHDVISYSVLAHEWKPDGAEVAIMEAGNREPLVTSGPAGLE